MEKTVVTVRWAEGLHMLPASRLVRLARTFRSEIRLRLGSKIAEASNVLSILLLCAALNSAVEIEATGTDEKDAVEAIQSFFDSSPDGQISLR